MRKDFKKTVLLSVLLLFSLFSAFAGEREIGENYIKKANLQMGRNSRMAAYFLDKAYDYSQDIPEYYYLRNRLIPDSRDNLHLKRQNADLLIESLGNYFYIDEYTLLKSAIDIYEKTRSYEKCIALYKILLSYKDRYLLDDYRRYIEVLFYADRADLVEEAVKEAMRSYSSLDLVYYRMLAGIRQGSLSGISFVNSLSRLYANNYSATRQLYLKVLFYSNPEIISGLVAEYYALFDIGGISAGFNKKILYQLIIKSEALTEESRNRLLTSWVEARGLSDYRSNRILEAGLFPADATSDLAAAFFNYTGMRSRDSNDDGLWEEFYRYEKGGLKDVIFDMDQDGLYERRVEFYERRSVKSIYIYRSRYDFDKYHFNRVDGSLVYVERHLDGEVTEKTHFFSSLLVPTDSEQLKWDNLVSYVDYKEYFTEGYTYEKYFNGEIEYINYDYDEDGLFEYKKLFTDGMLVEGLRDTVGDGIYDTLERYQGGRLKYLFTRTDPAFEGYDYKEEVIAGGLIKSWDENHDNIFEIAIEEYDGLIYEKYDINFDGKYDYVFKTVKKSSRTLYRVSNGRYQEINSREITADDGKKGWILVSAKDISGLETPDWIDLKDEKNYSGIFSYKGEKFFFKKGLIEGEKFRYRTYIIEGKLFLFDMMR